MSKKTKTNGTRRERLKRRLVSGFRAGLGLVVLVVTAYAGYAILGNSTENSLFQLREIRFEGARHTRVEELKEMIRSTFPGNSLRIRLDQVRAFVRSDTWVEEAEVRRQLPETIVIRVVERKPVAVATIDGEPVVVDREGVLLAPFGSEFQWIDQPIVKGLRNVAVENAAEDNRARMAAYLAVLADLSADPEDYSSGISEILVEDLDRIAVVPSDVAVPVYLGKDRFRARFETYLAGLDHLGEIREQHGNIESIDVTYDNKIIVRTPREGTTGTDSGD